MTTLYVHERKQMIPPQPVRVLNLPEVELNALLIQEFEILVASDPEIQELLADDKVGV